MDKVSKVFNFLNEIAPGYCFVMAILTLFSDQLRDTVLLWLMLGIVWDMQLKLRRIATKEQVTENE